ncbi:hypothetical protein FH972_026854 [Carpinus fangiana]|uniref:Expansin n=1 Tax=Carpinus fangiana TaxID=176857 RepID=A0A5N6L578_9ROSI|nr:hypothetical protein FH972_026854 [Carpinus fangiana]
MGIIVGTSGMQYEDEGDTLICGSTIGPSSSLARGSTLVQPSMKAARDHLATANVVDLFPHVLSVGGACGYEDVVNQGYGLDTAAISSVLFNNGQSCGACYEIKCVNDPQWCKSGQPSLFVTATNHCPPNYNLAGDNGGWCNPPNAHFDIAQPVFAKIAEYKAGVVPVQYRRIPCNKKGGIRFTITGNPYFNLVAVWNVGGAGDVIGLQVKGHRKLKWTAMKRNWGQKWETNAMMVGESLTFRVRASDGRYSTSWHIAPKNWQFGQTFEGKNFK